MGIQNYYLYKNYLSIHQSPYYDIYKGALGQSRALSIKVKVLKKIGFR